MSRGDEREVELPYGIRVASAWGWRLILLGALVYLVLRLLGHFEVMVVPFLVAVLLVALTRPLTDLLTKVIPRGVAALVTVFVVIGVVVGLGTLVAQQIASGFPDLENQASNGLGEVQKWLATG